MLRKIKAQFVLAAVALVGGGAVYLSTDVDYEALFPGYGALAVAVVGYLVREGAPKLQEYLRKYASAR